MMDCYHGSGSQSSSGPIPHELEGRQECSERFPAGAFCYVLTISLEKKTLSARLSSDNSDGQSRREFRGLIIQELGNIYDSVRIRALVAAEELKCQPRTCFVFE